MMNERVVGKVRFTDGTFRVVYHDERGQFVLDDDFEPIYGVWIMPAEDAQDEPVIVQAPAT
jgi:hypothetical protein